MIRVSRTTDDTNGTRWLPAWLSISGRDECENQAVLENACNASAVAIYNREQSPSPPLQVSRLEGF